MDGFYEEDERIVGHAADSYHRIDIRQTSRHLIVHSGEQLIAASTGPLVLCESGFATRWYVPPADVNEAALTPVEARPSNRTRACAAIAISRTRREQRGPIGTPGQRSDAYPAPCRSNRTRSR